MNFLEGDSPYIWCKSNTAFQEKNIKPTVKYGDRSVMVWGYFAASGPGRLGVINGTKNSYVLLKKIPVGECLSICSWLQAETNLGFAAERWLKRHQQLNPLLVEVKQNENSEVAKSKSSLVSYCDAVAWP